MAQVVARDIPDGSYVNLGIGQPTTVADYLDLDSGVILHTENGMLGMGPVATGDDIDPDLTNAGKQPVTELAGASYFHHADSFAMMRGGHLDVCIMGAFQVSAAGDLANWHTGGDGRHPGRRRGDGPGHRGEGRLRDDDAVRQGRRGQAGAVLHLPADRAGLREPGLHRPGHLPGRRRTA